MMSQGYRIDVGTTAAIVVAIAGALILEQFIGGPINKLLLRFPGIDKPLHVLGFAVMFFVFERLLSASVRNARRRVLVAVGLGIALALSDETLQSWFPHRNVELADIVADCCGLTLGASVAWPGAVARRQMLAVAAVTVASSITFISYLTTRDYSAGVRAEARRDYSVARQHYLKAFDSGLRTASLYNGLGWVEIESGEGDPAKALEYASVALSMRPEDADVLDTYGWALLHAGRSQDALPALLKALEKKPQMYCIHYHLGQTYRRLGRLSEAQAELELQLARTPAGPDALLARTALDELARETSR